MFDSLLPLNGLVVTLKLTRAVTLPFYHQAALTAFVRYLLGSPSDYDLYLTIDAPESGRIHYETGAEYRFSVMALADGKPLLSLLMQRLQALPGSVTKTGPGLHFSDNLQCVSLTDLWHSNPVHNIDQLTQWTPDNEAELWRHTQEPITLRWITPARLLKTKPEGQRKRKETGEQRYCRGDDDFNPKLWLRRLFDSTSSLLRRKNMEVPTRPALHQLQEVDQHLFWLAANYRGPSGEEDEQQGIKTMAGMSGVLRFMSPLPKDWLPLIIVGQYIGMGQYRAFGWGRYRLETDDGTFTHTRAHPVTSIMQRVSHPDNMRSAANKVDANRGKPGAHSSPSNSQDVSNQQPAYDKVAWMCNKLPDWQPAVLQGVLIAKDNGEPRALAIAPATDLIMQMAVTQILTPAIDSLLSPHSYGSRPGTSRINAAEAIQKAWRDGYRWVYESDIDDFFDSVKRQHLAHRLYCLYPDEPIVPLILAWMAAPVEWNEQLVERLDGVPQGSPLSPLMTNLLLDDFDNDMAMAGFCMIRFADDFIVACKTPQRAIEAAQLVQQSLADLDLQLNQDKTHTRSFAQGFRYLGYLFMNDLVVSSSKQSQPIKSPLQGAGWLARLNSQKLQKIEPDGHLSEGHDTQPLLSLSDEKGLGDMTQEGTMLLVTGDPALITSRTGQVWVTRDDENVSRTPWAHVFAIIILGRHHITTPALVHAMENSIPVHFVSRSGRYQGSANSATDASHVSNWALQQSAFSNTEQTLGLAKTVVQARIRHMREMLRLKMPRNHKQQLQSIRTGLKQDLLNVSQAPCRASLNGIEGAATRRYFQALKLLLPDTWAFSERNRRPPKDPVNAMLSLGYTILYSHVDSMLSVNGLMPWCGFYHQPRSGHAALASDMMEPFRHLVERTVLTVINRKQISPDDFTTTETELGVYLNHSARKVFLTQLEKCFLTPVKSNLQAEPVALHEQLYRQNRSLIDFLEDKAPFTSFIMR